MGVAMLERTVGKNGSEEAFKPLFHKHTGEDMVTVPLWPGEETHMPEQRIEIMRPENGAVRIHAHFGGENSVIYLKKGEDGRPDKRMIGGQLFKIS